MSENPECILIIDDEPLIRSLILSFVEIWGYRGVEAENGRVGLELYEKEEIDLVVTDLDMPEVKGLEVLSYLHDRAPELPVIIISGVGELDDAVQSIKLGAWDYLTKPIVNMGILEISIARCLEKVRLIRENRMYQEHLEDEVVRKTRELRENYTALQSEVSEKKKKQEEILRLNRHLETIVSGSGELFGFTTVRQLLVSVLKTMHLLVKKPVEPENHDEIDTPADSLAYFGTKEKGLVVWGEGRFSQYNESTLFSAADPELITRFKVALHNEQSEFGDNDLLAYVRTHNGTGCLFYLDNCQLVNDADKHLIGIYLSNVAGAVDAITLREEALDTQKEVVITLGEVIETRASQNANHVKRVAEYSYLLALKYGLKEQEATLLRFASPMHDTGKIAISDSLLQKPGELTSDEKLEMHHHTTKGFDILRKSRHEILEMAAIVALEHHERWDGAGYPRGLKNDEIHIYGRIVALADVFDTLGTRRCYKEPWSLDEVLSLIRKERGKHFDPTLVDILLEHLPEFINIKERYPDR